MNDDTPATFEDAMTDHDFAMEHDSWVDELEDPEIARMDSWMRNFPTYTDL